MIQYSRDFHGFHYWKKARKDHNICQQKSYKLELLSPQRYNVIWRKRNNQFCKYYERKTIQLYCYESTTDMLTIQPIGNLLNEILK